MFADDTALLYSNKDPKKIRKHVNTDLKLLLKWLKANKISLNVKKIEMILFTEKRKKSNYEIKIKLDGKKLFPAKSIKYLGIYLDEHLTWNHQTEFLANKLRRANGMLSNLRHYVPRKLLRTAYYAIFQSNLVYGLQVWGQNLPLNCRIEKLQKSAVRIMTFSNPTAHSKPLFERLNIPRLSHLLFSNNIKLAHQTLNQITPVAIRNILNLRYISNPYTTRNARIKLLSRPFIRTRKFGFKSIRYQVILDWNSLQEKNKYIDLAGTRLSIVNQLVRTE